MELQNEQSNLFIDIPVLMNMRMRTYISMWGVTNALYNLVFQPIKHLNGFEQIFQAVSVSEPSTGTAQCTMYTFGAHRPVVKI